MSADTVCRVCLISNLNLYDVRNDLQNAFERITKEKYNKAGYPVLMCCICLSVLRKCQKFMETVQDTDNVLQEWYNCNQSAEMRKTKPLFTYSVTKVKLVSVDAEDNSLEPIIKQETEDIEEPSTKIQTVYAECDVYAETDTEQTDNGDIFVDIPFNNTTEADVDNKNDVLLKTNMYEWGGLDMASEDNNGTKLTEDDQEMEAAEDSEQIHDSDKKKNMFYVKVKPISAILNPTGCKEKRLHVCDFCNRSWKSSRILRRHIIMKHSAEIRKYTKNKLKDKFKRYSCEECSYKCIKINTLLKHLRKHKTPLSSDIRAQKLKQNLKIKTGEKPFQCDTCGYKCRRKCDLIRHLNVHSSVKSFACDLCHYKCKEKYKLKLHIRRTHAGDKPFTCDFCGHKCKQKRNFLAHLRTHTDKPFSCDMCNYRCKLKYKLTLHMRTHTGEKPFSCHFCSYRSAYRATLNAHMRTHSRNKPTKVYQDTETTEDKLEFEIPIFSNSNIKQTHKSDDVKDVLNPANIFHIQMNANSAILNPNDAQIDESGHVSSENQLEAESKIYSCTECTYRCKKKNSLLKHLIIHKNPFTCNICGRKCAHQSDFTRHLNTHSDERPYSCDMCDYRGKSKGNLTAHKKTHSNDKPFECNVCGYKCGQKSDFARHLNTHSNVRPFSCNICNYKGKQRSNLRAHMKTHFGYKPFSCDSCDYKCAQKSDFTRHQSTHSNERPYLCDLCDYRGKHKSNLTAHMKTHSDDKAHTNDNIIDT